MNVHTQNPSHEIVTLVGGIPKTNSLTVAQKFGKRHDNVMRDIKNLECSADFRLLNFEETFREVPGPNNSIQKQPLVEMTRDGFTFLAMGFTGKEAAAWKERYIAAFNQMEAALRAAPNPPRFKLYGYPLLEKPEPSACIAALQAAAAQARRARMNPTAPDYDCPLWRLLDELSRDGSDVGACLAVYRHMKRVYWHGEAWAREVGALAERFRVPG